MEYRFLPNVALSDNENPPRGIRSAKQDLWQVESDLSACLKHVQENYIKIGILLKKIKEETLYSFCSYEKENGETVPCRTVEEYAFLRFGLSKTVVFNSIAIVEKFLIRANDEDIAFYPKLNGFGYSALCELVPLTKNCTRYSSDVGTLPEWVEEEIKPEMSVKEIREVKKRHKKVVVKNTTDDNDKPDDLERQDDECSEEKRVGSFHIFKNDIERKFVFENYRNWDIFSVNEYLGLTYYRLYLGKNVYAIAIGWKTDEPYYVKTNGGYRNYFYIFEKGKAFNMDSYSISTLLRVIKEKNLHCDLEVWNRMHEKK